MKEIVRSFPKVSRDIHLGAEPRSGGMYWLLKPVRLIDKVHKHFQEKQIQIFLLYVNIISYLYSFL